MDAVTPPLLSQSLGTRAATLEAKLIAWRRDFHANPELGNREFRTAKIVAEHLSALGLEVKTHVAHTGVVGILRGAKPGPCIALRADMDALPVAEEVEVSFASTIRTTYDGEEVGVMHACGHDAHTAIMMAVAEVLADLQAELPGTIKFVFQPAEEGAPEGEEGGAALMVKEGVLADPKPDAIFGLHILSALPTGILGFRPGPAMASVDNFSIDIEGRQTHAAMPWLGIDPIVAASQVVMGLQTIVSRQIDTSEDPAVVTVGAIRGGIRENIIPDTVAMKGTIRAFTERAREDIGRRVQATATNIACACGASATVKLRSMYPVTVNHAELTKWSVAKLQEVAGAKNVHYMPKILGGEDFAFYQQQVPGFFYFVGITPRDRDPATAPPNHSPRFYVDEAGLMLGLRSMAALALEYLRAPPALK